MLDGASAAHGPVLLHSRTGRPPAGLSSSPPAPRCSPESPPKKPLSPHPCLGTCFWETRPRLSFLCSADNPEGRGVERGWRGRCSRCPRCSANAPPAVRARLRTRAQTDQLSPRGWWLGGGGVRTRLGSRTGLFGVERRLLTRRDGSHRWSGVGGSVEGQGLGIGGGERNGGQVCFPPLVRWVTSGKPLHPVGSGQAGPPTRAKDARRWEGVSAEGPQGAAVSSPFSSRSSLLAPAWGLTTTPAQSIRLGESPRAPPPPPPLTRT